MKIDAAHHHPWTSETARREQDHHVQDVFSEVLASVGREGYRSARAIDQDQPLDQQVDTAWSDWFGIQRTGRYASLEDPSRLEKPFGSILVRSLSQNGYTDPKQFLQNLSSEDLSVVQQVHWLADPIQVRSLSEEGALNLLLPPAAQVDLNHDGMTNSGAALGIRFPDSRTPPETVQAWDEATEGMSWGERSVYELQMKLPVLVANIKLDENGAYSHHFAPGDPQWVNPLADPDYSYIQSTRDRIKSLDYFKNQLDPIRYQKNRAFWSDFQQSLIDHRSR